MLLSCQTVRHQPGCRRRGDRRIRSLANDGALNPSCGPCNVLLEITPQQPQQIFFTLTVHLRCPRSFAVIFARNEQNMPKLHPLLIESDWKWDACPQRSPKTSSHLLQILISTKLYWHLHCLAARSLLFTLNTTSSILRGTRTYWGLLELSAALRLQLQLQPTTALQQTVITLPKDYTRMPW